MSKNQEKSYFRDGICGALAGGVFLVLLFCLQWNIWLDIALAVGSYIGISLLCRKERRIGNISVTKLENGEELERRLLEAKEDAEAIAGSLQKIRDDKVKTEAESLNRTAQEIISYLERHPEKIRLARRFIDYYQDTASSILKQYVELEYTQLETKELEKLKADLLRSLHTLNGALEQQFQKLLQNEMMDMDAQMRLLEQTVKMEEIHG